MAYKHEEINKTVIAAYYNYLGDGSGIKEIEKVYAKARAFDEIVNLLKTSDEYYAEDNLEDVELIICEYEEDNEYE